MNTQNIMDPQNMTLGNFDALFETLIRHPDDNIKIHKLFKNVEPSNYLIYTVGIKLCEKEDISNEVKEQIIYKLLFLFPKCHILLARKRTRLNSSHITISYAVFCLKKKKKHTTHINPIRS